MKTWQEAARGIEPWPGAWFYTPSGTRRLCMGVDRCVAWSESNRFPADCCALDLADPDTRAAFDRRLALRLGAPPEAVDEGVLVYKEGPDWTIGAGVFRGYGDVFAWFHDLGPLDHNDDPLLARALAWRSVP